MNPDQVSYMMLFCSMMLVRNARASLQESMTLLPLAGPAKELAEHLGRSREAA